MLVIDMEKKTYTDGKRTIRATPVAYEVLYKNQGFKPTEGGNNDKGRGNRNHKSKNSNDSTGEATDERDLEILD